MTNELSIVNPDKLDRDLYASSQARERALNAAIIHANISERFEEYLEIFDEFYADDVEVSSETEEEPIHGKARVRSLIANFLVPLHIMAEIGGLLISIRQTAIPGFCGRDAFRVDARTGWCVRQVLCRELARPPEMERIADRVRISLRPSAKWRAPDVQ